MARRNPRRRRGGGSSLSGRIWLAAAVALVLAIGTGWYTMSQRAQTRATDAAGCPAHGDPPAAALVLVDATDRLSAETAAYVVKMIEQDAGQLPELSRVTIVPFGDDTAAPLAPIFSRCLPGRTARFDQNQHAVDAARQDFDASLNTLKSQLEQLPSRQNRPPITAQGLSAPPAIPSLQWRGDPSER